MDTQQGHQYFSVDCFNEVWNLMEKSPRTYEEDCLMREMAHASLFHWLNRDDCDHTKTSVGLWLISRVYATLGQGAGAKKYAEECIEVSKTNSLPPFYLGYGYEAAARAAIIANDREGFDLYIKLAGDQLAEIEDREEKILLSPDIDALKATINGDRADDAEQNQS